LVHDGPFVFADGEVVAAKLVGPDEVRELLQSEQFVPDSIEIVVPLLAGKWHEALGR
jgi:predicted thioredoxin/glutaredoxin